MKCNVSRMKKNESRKEEVRCNITQTNTHTLWHWHWHTTHRAPCRGPQCLLSFICRRHIGLWLLQITLTHSHSPHSININMACIIWACIWMEKKKLEENRNQVKKNKHPKKSASISPERTYEYVEHYSNQSLADKRRENKKKRRELDRDRW